MYTRYTCQMPVIFSSSTTTNTTTLPSYKTTKVPGIQHYNYNYDTQVLYVLNFCTCTQRAGGEDDESDCPAVCGKGGPSENDGGSGGSGTF